MKKYAVLLLTICVFVVFLPTHAQDNDQRITPANAEQIVLLGIGLQVSAEVVTGAIAPDWSYAVIGLASEEGDFLVWDLATGMLRYQAATHHQAVSSITISPDGRWIVIASTDGTIQVWNAANDSDPLTLCDANANWGEMSVVFSPDGTRLASAGNFESLVQIWDTTRWELVTALTDSANVWLVQFSPDGSMIAGGDPHRGTRVWDAATGEILFQVPPPNSMMYWSAWAPYGPRLLTGCDDGTLCLWQVESGERIWQTTETVFYVVRAVAFNPHGSLLASAAEDTTGIILDVNNGSVVKQLDLDYGNRTMALSWSSDSTQLASIAQDGSLQFWGLPGFQLPTPATVAVTLESTVIAPTLPPTLTPIPPISATRTPTRTPIPMLRPGGHAQVYVINEDTLNVRVDPIIAENILERLELGAVVTLLEGPVDTGGYRWWRVRTAYGVEGWAVEGADGVQTLIPLD